MLKFAVFDEDGPARAWPLRHAHLIGPDDIPVPAEIDFEKGEIRCQKSSSGAAALCLLFDSGANGDLMLQTCLLPERERPYLLSLELARHRIMLFLNKLEEWLHCELSPEDEAMTLFERARGAFTTALTADRTPEGTYSPEQVRLARESLRLAIDASERLALLVAEHTLARRLGAPANANGLANAPIGCVVRPAQGGEALQRIVRESFDFLVAPMRWTDLEPSEGEYAFTQTDKWIEWAARTAKMPVMGGPLIDLRPGCTPDWLGIWDNDYETLREVVYGHLKQVVGRYRKAVNRWVVGSGLHLNTSFSLTLEHLMDLTRICVMVVRKMQPNAKIYLEIDQPFGEHYAAHPSSAPPLLYAEMVSQHGLSIDAFALRVQMGGGMAGRATRDMMQLSAMLDAYSQFDKPLIVSAMGAPSTPPPAATDDADADAEDPGPDRSTRDPGYWRGPWSPESQAEWLMHALTIALGKPYVQSVAWSDLYDSPPGADCDDMPGAGLISGEGRAKPAMHRMAQIRRAMRDRTPPTRIIRASAPPEETAI
ncbi:MAG: hypothetical protein EA379_00820 [Phycisphaerales bacterium]|nr:MAG: hypothetical protein EA379_00820 [Phycisphaerales bacterium]